jgi:hypothetical protein
MREIHRPGVNPGPPGGDARPRRFQPFCSSATGSLPLSLKRSLGGATTLSRGFFRIFLPAVNHGRADENRAKPEGMKASACSLYLKGQQREENFSDTAPASGDRRAAV